MTIKSGMQFSFYQILDPIGAGGMGEVYRATDARLKRDVAIKVLPESFATDADRLARFQREAELLASLNHTNIAQIHGIETANGITALIMELIDGPTLADRIAQGPLPTDEALNIAMQICSALEAAHDKGIVHRDLKPANIKLRPDGTVKVLDFGIAKAIDNQAGNSGQHAPALTTPAMTMSGVILGTAAYMSPEQARGKAVDERADIWAFGCVLYEMLTGQPVFGGEDVTITLARVLEREIDMNTIPVTLPAAVRHTIRLCLRKDPKKRIRDISDVRLALQGEFETVAAGSGTTLASTQPWSRRMLPLAAGLLIGGVLIGLAAWNLKPPPAPAPQALNRFAQALPAEQLLRNVARNALAFSPDGRRFVYNTTQGLFLRDLDELVARLIPGTELSLDTPFFSPDGQSIGFSSGTDAKLKRISINGGVPVNITDSPNAPMGASWAADNTILFGQIAGIMRVPASGGTAELVIAAQAGERLGSPELLPDGDTVLFSATTGVYDWDAAQVIVQSLSTGVRTVLVQGGSDAHYLPSGHLVYALGDGLFAVAFDPATLTVSGGAVPLLQGLQRADATGSANYGVAANGTLVYLAGSTAYRDRSLVWVSRDGRETPVPIEPGVYVYPRISPDGKRVALDDRNGGDDLWVWDFAGATRTRLTVGNSGGQYPAWSTDGTRLAFNNRDTDAIAWKAANNTDEIEALAARDLLDQSDTVLNSYPKPYFFSPSGQQLVFGANGPGTRTDIGMLTLGSTAEPVWLLREPYLERNAELSPNGRWMAYESNASGTVEIYVRPFPNVNDDLVQVSNAGGTQALWSHDGSELFYLQGDTTQTRQLMAVAVKTDEATFAFGARTVLLPWSWFSQIDGRTYDISLDGQQFLALTEHVDAGPDGNPPQIIIVENWVEELARLVPVE